MTLRDKAIAVLKRPKTLLALILTGLVLTLVIQNTRGVETRFLWIKVEMPHALLILSMFLVGFVVGWLVGAWSRRVRA